MKFRNFRETVRKTACFDLEMSTIIYMPPTPLPKFFLVDKSENVCPWSLKFLSFSKHDHRHGDQDEWQGWKDDVDEHRYGAGVHSVYSYSV